MKSANLLNQTKKSREDHERLELQARVMAQFKMTILRDLGVKPWMHVLDLGCGSGLTSIQIAGLTHQGSVLGVDRHKALVKRAEENRVKSGVSNLSFTCGDIYSLNLEKRDFDFAYACFLFQHLSDPGKALTRALNYLKPGGRLCVVDVDDQFLAIHPETEGFNRLCSMAEQVQAQKGGDRFIGRKLVSFFHEAGFEDVDLEVRIVTSRQIGFKNFVDITTGFKRELIPSSMLSSGKVDEYLNEIYSLGESALGIVGLFVVTGEKCK